MVKCGSFYGIFKVVVVIDESDYFHGDDITPTLPILPSSYGQSLLNPDSFTATSTFNENLLCLILLKCYLPFLSKSLVQCMINGTTNYCLYDKKMSSIMILNGILYVQRMREDDHSHLTDCLVIETSFLTNRFWRPSYRFIIILTKNT